MSVSRPGVKSISTGYQPRPLQQVLHNSLKRFNVLVCHRRFGKTVFCINEMIDRGLRCTRPNPRYAYLAPLYGQAKRVAWDYLKQYTSSIPGAVPNEADLRVDLPHNGARFTLLGADNPASLKGIYLDGVILDEYAEMNPAAWREVIRPTLSDRLGWGIFIGTPKGRNAFWDLYDGSLNGFPIDDGSRFTDPEWAGFMYKASETKILPQSELDAARRVMTEEEYEQEYECSFQAGLVGAYYSKEITTAEKEGRIQDVPYDPALPVETYWDLGLNDTTAIWFVQKNRARHQVIDYEEAPDLSIPEWIKILRKKNYVYGRAYLPHDAAARDLSTGETRQKNFQNLGVKTKIVPKQDPLDGIHAVRMIFPKCIFDRAKCKRGLDALMNYQRKWDAKQNVFSAKPLHNWASNGADAFRTFAMGVDDRDEDMERSSSRIQVISQYDVFGT